MSISLDFVEWLLELTELKEEAVPLEDGSSDVPDLGFVLDKDLDVALRELLYRTLLWDTVLTVVELLNKALD